MKESQRLSRVSGCSTVQFWLEQCVDIDDLTEMPEPNYRPTSFIKIPFCWAFYYLKKNYQYEDAIRDMIRRCGDTSMNAAIVGGLLGAIHGKPSIPQYLFNAVLEFDPATNFDS